MHTDWYRRGQRFALGTYTLVDPPPIADFYRGAMSEVEADVNNWLLREPGHKFWVSLSRQIELGAISSQEFRDENLPTHPAFWNSRIDPPLIDSIEDADDVIVCLPPKPKKISGVPHLTALCRHRTIPIPATINLAD